MSLPVSGSAVPVGLPNIGGECMPDCATEIADWYILLATELVGEGGRGGSPTRDCDIMRCVSSSISDESES